MSADNAAQKALFTQMVQTQLGTVALTCGVKDGQILGMTGFQKRFSNLLGNFFRVSGA